MLVVVGRLDCVVMFVNSIVGVLLGIIMNGMCVLIGLVLSDCSSVLMLYVKNVVLISWIVRLVGSVSIFVIRKMVVIGDVVIDSMCCSLNSVSCYVGSWVLMGGEIGLCDMVGFLKMNGDDCWKLVVNEGLGL